MANEKAAWVVVTGAAGFIGSVLAAHLLEQGRQVVGVDDFDRVDKKPNFQDKNFTALIHREQFFDWWATHHDKVEQVYHLGARTDTTEMDRAVHEKWNTAYSKQVWQLAAQYGVPLVYASSAATYGDGVYGYDDDHALVSKLQPLNPYGASKQDFDVWALAQTEAPPFWAGVKFFNVYGPNEYHKGRMASVIYHAYHQIKKEGSIKLFRSHHPNFKDGEQIRDFIYVYDIVSICLWLMNAEPQSGLYNAGTGKGRTFIDLAKAVFNAMHLPEDILFIDTPIDIRDKYQYYTEAKMHKLLSAGYTHNFQSLEEGITHYVQQYLMAQQYV